jgi:hypothetical protein
MISCCFWLVIWPLGLIAIGISIVTSMVGISMGATTVYIASKKPAQRTTQKVAVGGIIISFLGLLPLAIFLPAY